MSSRTATGMPSPAPTRRRWPRRRCWVTWMTSSTAPGAAHPAPEPVPPERREATARAPENRAPGGPGTDLGRAADAREFRPAGDLRAPVPAHLAGRRRGLDPGLRARASRRHGIDIAHVEANFRAAFLATWMARSRTTASTACCWAADLNARQIIVLRAFCRYLLQTGVPFSQAYMERTLAANAAVAKQLVRLFLTRFDPAGRRARPRAPGAKPRHADPQRTRCGAQPR